MDVVMLMGVNSAVNRLVASKMRREFFRKAMSMCCGKVKPWGRYEIIQQDRGILYQLQCSFEMVFITSTMFALVEEWFPSCQWRRAFDLLVSVLKWFGYHTVVARTYWDGSML